MAAIFVTQFLHYRHDPHHWRDGYRRFSLDHWFSTRSSQSSYEILTPFLLRWMVTCYCIQCDHLLLETVGRCTKALICCRFWMAILVTPVALASLGGWYLSTIFWQELEDSAGCHAVPTIHAMVCHQAICVHNLFSLRPPLQVIQRCSHKWCPYYYTWWLLQQRCLCGKAFYLPVMHTTFCWCSHSACQPYLNKTAAK